VIVCDTYLYMYIFCTCIVRECQASSRAHCTQYIFIPKFQTIFDVSKRSPRNSNDLPGNPVHLEIQIFEDWISSVSGWVQKRSFQILNINPIQWHETWIVRECQASSRAHYAHIHICKYIYIHTHIVRDILWRRFMHIYINICIVQERQASSRAHNTNINTFKYIYIYTFIVRDRLIHIYIHISSNVYSS